jgi:PPP family 3-phenylpropionic acid transporter
MTGRVFSLRISMTYALLMLGSGVQLPFLPLWLKAKGLETSDIAMILAGMMATRILGAPLFAWIADHFGNRRLVIQLCGGFAFATYLLLAISNGFSPIATMALIASFMFAPVFPLIEGFSVDGSAAHGLDYGRLRLWASLSFLTGSLVSGALLTQLDPLNTAWLIAVAQGLAFVSTLILPVEPEAAAPDVDFQDVPGGARQLFFASSFPFLIVAVGLGQASHGMLFSFSSVHWASLGFGSFAIGSLWTGAVLAEVLLFALSARILQKFGPSRLLLIGMCGGIVRWLIMAFATHYVLMFFAQTLHALSFATVHLGTMHFIRLMAPPQTRNRAQGVYAALSGGVFMSASAWTSGGLYQNYGGLAYLFMAAISVAALVMVLLLLRLSPTVRAAGAA